MYEPCTSSNTREIAKQIGNTYLSCPTYKDNSDDDSGDSLRLVNSDLDSDYEEQEQITKTKRINCHSKTPQTSTSTEGTKNPFIFWSLIFDESILAHILECTNKKIESRSISTKMEWRPLCMNELQAFLGLLVYTAVFRSNDEHCDDLFATDGTAREIYRLVMTRKRFGLLLRLLCFDSPTPEGHEWGPKEEKLAPVSYIFNKLVENCKNNYTVGPIVTIDEQFFSAENNLLKQKPSAYGIKIQFLCDAETNYFFDGHLCTEECEAKEIFTDGMVKQEHEEGEVKPPHQFEKAKTMDEIMSKSVVYTCRRRQTSMWQMCVFYYLLDISTVNSYVLYQNNTDATDSMEVFLKNHARSLIMKHLLEKVNKTWLHFESRLAIRRILGNEAPPLAAPTGTVVRKTSERNHSNRQACKLCPRAKQRKTYYICMSCKIPICLQCCHMVCVPCSENVTFEGGE